MRIRFVLPGAVCSVFCLAANGLWAQTGPEPPQPDQDPTGHTGVLKANVQTGCGYNAHNGNGTRSVTDLQVPGALGEYGLDFARHWNSLPPGDEPRMPAAMPFSDFGASGWSHSWGWSAVYEEEGPKLVIGADANTETDGVYKTSITITFPDGHVSKYSITRRWPGGPGYIGDPRHGPPYSAQEANWTDPGVVHDHLEQMAPDGSSFWLHRADGGSVYFVGDSWTDHQGHKDWSYQAQKVYDPHGFRTDLEYADGFLVKVTPEDGQRWLTIKWGYVLSGSLAPVIKRVETGGVTGAQAVNYTYAITGSAVTLRTVEYLDDPDPNVSCASTNCIQASYLYENSLLKEANDPYFAGAMTRIRYQYRMERCLDYPVSDPPDAHFDYIYAQGEAVTEEQSPENDQFGNPIVVSRFGIHCWDGTRTEWNGMGGWRKFYYGHSATWPGSGSHGHELAKVTDFTWNNVNVADVRQSHLNGNPNKLWDGFGILTQLTYGDGSGLPVEVRHAGSDNSARSYNRVDPGNSAPRDPGRIHNPYHRWLFSQTDERGLTTTYRRDERRRVTDIIYADNSSEHFAYNEWNQVILHRLASHAPGRPAEITYNYDDRHRLWREWNTVDGEANGTIYQYDNFDRVKSISHPWSRAKGAPFSVEMTYNRRHQVLTEKYPTTNSGANPSKQYEYDPYGNCTAITNELGHRSEYTYDSYRRCTSYTEPLNAPDANGVPNVPSRRWDWIYDRYVEGIGWKPASAHTSKSWRIQVEPAFNYLGERRMTNRWHDLNHRVTLEQTGWIQRASPAALGDWYCGPDGETRAFTYDANGNKSSYTDARGRGTSYEYDLRNRLTRTIEPLDRITETLYDATGNKTLVKFPDQRTQQWLDYDPFGQARTFIDERNHTTNLSYVWGPMKKLYTVTTYRSREGGGMEDQRTTFSYDLLGRPTQILFPDGSDEFSTYQFGQLKTWQTRKDQVKTIEYDARGREVSNGWSGEAAPRITRTWDAAGRLTSIANSVATINYGYDDAAQVRWESEYVAGADTTVQTNYLRYPDGGIWNLQYPNGTLVARAYTARGQLENVWEKSTGSWRGSIYYNYYPDGKINYQYYGNGMMTGVAYDERGQIQIVSTYHNPSGNRNYSWRYYWRDDRDRIVAWQKSTDNVVNPMENGRGDFYLYDAEGQLKSAWYESTDPAHTHDHCQRQDHFDYDELGNRHKWNYVQTRGWLYWTGKDNGLNQYRAWSPYSIINYDDDIGGTWGGPGAANGVLMQDGHVTAGFNALNQPMYIWSGTNGWMHFGYDPLGRCVKRWNDNGAATYLYYDGWNLIQEGPQSWNPSRLYIHGARVDELVAQISPGSNAIRYFHYDANGNCILQTDGSGALTEQYYYDAFGYPYFHDKWGTNLGSSPSGNRFLFCGREWLNDLKQYDFRNRMYHPELGRFVQPDPKHFAAGDSNLYRYCHNDPVNRIDPMGLETVEFRRYEMHLGSWIPQTVTYAVNFTTSGNYQNADPSSHHTDSDLRRRDGSRVAGLTIAKVTVSSPNNGTRTISANLNIDWFVRRSAAEKDPGLARLEAQHTPLLLKYWDRMKANFAGGYATRFGGWWAGFNVNAKLQRDLSSEKMAQKMTLDCQDCAHDYEKPY